MRNIILLSCFLILLACGCNSNSVTTGEGQQAELNYFDLKGYFEKEVVRLKNENPDIHKTVTVNRSSETKTIKVKDWSKELTLFSDADINKTSWKGLFQYEQLGNIKRYFSEDDKIPVKELLVIYKNGNVYGLKIIEKNINALYTSIDTLTYYPDSAYQIKKTQNIKLLSPKNYIVLGIFK